MATLQKRPFKLIEIPLKKFNDEAIPHHERIFEQHKNTVHKLIATNKLQELSREVKDKKRIVGQLMDLLYELDTLRAQVADIDLDKFDEKTFSLRKIITGLVKNYSGLQRQALEITETQNQINENIENENPFEGASQLQLGESISNIKLKEHENRLEQVQALENDVQDLHGIYVDLNQMVIDQAQPIDAIENNTEETQENVNEGLRQLTKASKYKAAAYPVTGMIVGTLVGGPIGLVAGFKVGGIAALGCGIAGYTGGKFFKKAQQTEEPVLQSQSEDTTLESESKNESGNGTVEKKDK